MDDIVWMTIDKYGKTICYIDGTIYKEIYTKDYLIIMENNKVIEKIKID